MGKQKTITFSCDRCGVKEVEPNHEAKKGWYEASSVSYGGDSLLLCQACFERLIEWVNEARSKPITKEDADWNF